MFEENNQNFDVQSQGLFDKIKYFLCMYFLNGRYCIVYSTCHEKLC